MEQPTTNHLMNPFNLQPVLATLLGSVLGIAIMDPNDSGGSLNVGIVMRAALFGSVPRPKWEEGEAFF